MVGGGGGGGGHGGGGGGGGGGHGGGGHGGGGHGGHGGGGVFTAPLFGYPSWSRKKRGSSTGDVEAPLLDQSFQTFRTRAEYFGVAAFILVCTVFMVYCQWPDWHASLVIVITFSYSTAMALLLVKHCNNKQEREDQLELTAASRYTPQSTWVQMLVVTGIMIISLALAVSNFHSKPEDVGQIMFFSVVCATLGFLFSHGMLRNGSENSCA